MLFHTFLCFQAVMIGDDIVSDVGGAQACGIRGVQVRTGKYRYGDKNQQSQLQRNTRKSYTWEFFKLDKVVLKFWQVSK